ncbi:MAG TPA: hypothetical protein VNT76_12225 [Candidatus Binatus sp.]|nr:hypothetical protein [Candidatus Binatus sp.]
MAHRFAALGAFVLTLCLAQFTFAQAPEDSRLLELVDRLKDIIQRAERNRSDPATLNQLRELVRRYDWPWRLRLLFEDFSDGDFSGNPAWNVRIGEFRVIRGVGLRTYVGLDSVSRPSPTDRERNRTDDGFSANSAIEDIVGGILRGVLEPGTGNQFRSALPAAEISTSVGIASAFAVKLRMLAREKNPPGSRIEFGTYCGNERDWGYRLAYALAPQPSLEILRLSPGRSAVVERYDGATGLEDGRAHLVELRRERGGAMQVLVDSKEYIRTMDKGVGDFFDGFTIVNSGGEYSFERIEVYGTEK